MTPTLKHEKGWFAAGIEVQNALNVLSDGAFKLFVHLCLAAPRRTGVVETSQTELARTLHKGNLTIRKYLRELEAQGICRLSGFLPVPYSRGRIEITDDYWPYRRGPRSADNPSDGTSVDQVRKLLEARSCVAASFSTADEILARQWLDQGIPLERIEQAVLLGCARKYVSWRNHHDTTPIQSLHYFQGVLDEVDHLEVSSDYWSYVRSRMRRMEELWDRNRQRNASPEPEP